MSTESARRIRLKDFLRAKRMALTPEQVGLRNTGRRRTPGLRREEVAALAGIGITWYTWLEQGRDIHVSTELLSRLARTLRLSPSDVAYLHSIAGHLPPSVPAATDTIPQPIRLALDAVSLPAFVLNPRFDVVAYNDLANRIYGFDADLGPLSKNHLWRYFKDPARRRLFPDWMEFAHMGVRIFRANYATRVGDPDFEMLLKEMQECSGDFSRIWNEQHTSSLQIGEVRMRLENPGVIMIQSVKFTIPDRPDDVLYLLLPADAKARSAFAKLRKRRRR